MIRKIFLLFSKMLLTNQNLHVILSHVKEIAKQQLPSIIDFQIGNEVRFDEEVSEDAD